jgi:hypothetical protein
MTISARDFQTALRRIGVGSPAGDSLRAQADALQAAGDYASATALRFQAGEFDSGIGLEQAAAASPSTASSGQSVGSEIASLVSSFAPLAVQGATLGLTAAGVLRPVAPLAAAPAKPLSTGAKVAIGIGVAGGAAGLAYALWPKSRSRRRR